VDFKAWSSDGAKPGAVVDGPQRPEAATCRVINATKKVTHTIDVAGSPSTRRCEGLAVVSYASVANAYGGLTNLLATL
jgi:hypothetical protein